MQALHTVLARVPLIWSALEGELEIRVPGITEAVTGITFGRASSGLSQLDMLSVHDNSVRGLCSRLTSMEKREVKYSQSCSPDD